MILINIIIIVVATIVGALISQLVFKRLNFVDIKKTKAKAEKLLENSKQEAETIQNEALIYTENIKQNTEDMLKQMKTLIHTIEQNVKFKEEIFEKKEMKNTNLRGIILDLQEAINKSEERLVKLEGMIKDKLAIRCGQTIESLKDSLIRQYSADLSEEKIEHIKKKLEYASENAEKIAKNMLRSSIQRYTDTSSVEKKEAKIIVHRDEIKAIIVGRNAENILLFEKLLDVDVVFNDEPKTIVVSTFDLLRKNVARVAMEKLVKMRHIGEKEIKTAIAEAKKIIEQDLVEVGKKAVKKMGFKRKFDPDLIKIIGRLKYRTSYGQNILLHSFEVASMAELLAGELGLDQEKTKIAAFFHDIGKAIDQHIEGSHDVLTREIMTKFGFPEDEIHAAWTHHEAETPQTAEARIVMAADAISAGRPGARQESLQRYIERLRALEEIATSHEGVNKTYAISAGRELRVLVNPDDVSDGQMDEMAGDIAKEIENKLSYPGKIKINIIRRTKAVDFAK
ncbi:DUF3552 domain-containing protein [bacterium]|nr:DUF3552 domain-containing protein [bacterium]